MRTHVLGQVVNPIREQGDLHFGRAGIVVGALERRDDLAAAAVLVAFVSSSVPLTALAQDDAVTMQARARFKEGVDFYDKGAYENARLAFLQAYALKKHPAVLLNLAQSSAKAGHPLEAAKYFQQYLKESTSASPQQRQDAESGLAEVRQKLGRVEVIAPAGAEITLDEKERLGTTPFAEPIDVEPGAHSLRSSSETVRVNANAGQKVQARFGTSAVAVAPAPVPIAPPPSAPPESTSPVPPAADKGGGSKDPLPMTPGYIAVGVAGAGIASAIIFAAFKADSQSKADSVARDIRTAAGSRSAGICTSTATDDVKRFGDACKTLKDNNSKVDTNATIANVSIGVAAVAGIFAISWLVAVPLVNRKREHSAGPIKNPVLTPYAGFDSGGFELSGSF